MNRHVQRGLRALSATTALTALTVVVGLAAPAAYADDLPTGSVTYTGDDDAPSTNVGEAVDDTVATVTDILDTSLKGCVPYVYTWDDIWHDPIRYTVPNGSVYYRETGGGRPRILCPGTVRLTALVMDESATSPYVWGRYFGINQVITSGSTPSVVATVDVPYAGWDASSAPVVGDLGLPRPYGQITVQVKVERRLSTGRFSMIKNGCVEFYWLIQPEAGFGVSDPTRGDGTGFSPCPADAKILTYDTLDNIQTG